MNKSKLFAPLLLALALLCLVNYSAPSAQAANLVLNGGFEATTNLSSPGGYFCSDNGSGGCLSNVTSWTSVCRNGACGGGGTPTALIFPGTGGSAFNGIGFNAPSSNSPDGGNYVAADADAVYNSAISQTIKGLTTGAYYTVSFYQASDQQKGNSTPFSAQFQVSLGASTQLSQTISNSGGVFTPWVQQFITFQATATSEVLSFLAVSPSGAPPVALLDGVTLTTATPEASTWYLALTALAGIALYARFRQRRNARA